MCKEFMFIASVLLPTRTLTLKESIAIRDRPVSGRDAFLLRFFVQIFRFSLYAFSNLLCLQLFSPENVSL